jgi:hypothetical protein
LWDWSNTDSLKIVKEPIKKWLANGCLEVRERIRARSYWSVSLTVLGLMLMARLLWGRRRFAMRGHELAATVPERAVERILPRLQSVAFMSGRTPDTALTLKNTALRYIEDDQEIVAMALTPAEKRALMELAVARSMIPSESELQVLDALQENSDMLWRMNKFVKTGDDTWFNRMMGRTMPK